MKRRPEELDDPARTAPPPEFVPIPEEGLELGRFDAWQAPPDLIHIYGQTPFGEFVIALRSGTAEDIPAMRASMVDGLYAEIYRIEPVDWSNAIAQKKAHDGK